jgi:hypothetical protein
MPLYTDGVPAKPVLVSGWVRDGHPEDATPRLATDIAAAVSRICNIRRGERSCRYPKQPSTFRRRRRPFTPQAGP